MMNLGDPSVLSLAVGVLVALIEWSCLISVLLWSLYSRSALWSFWSLHFYSICYGLHFWSEFQWPQLVLYGISFVMFPTLLLCLSLAWFVVVFTLSASWVCSLVCFLLGLLWFLHFRSVCEGQHIESFDK